MCPDGGGPINQITLVDYTFPVFNGAVDDDDDGNDDDDRMACAEDQFSLTVMRPIRCMWSSRFDLSVSRVIIVVIYCIF